MRPKQLDLKYFFQKSLASRKNLSWKCNRSKRSTCQIALPFSLEFTHRWNVKEHLAYFLKLSFQSSFLDSSRACLWHHRFCNASSFNLHNYIRIYLFDLFYFLFFVQLLLNKRILRNRENLDVFLFFIKKNIQICLDLIIHTKI